MTRWRWAVVVGALLLLAAAAAVAVLVVSERGHADAYPACGTTGTGTTGTACARGW
ncbi:hypothetical protein [Streptomyces sp. NPDC048720]|uniref:hypothetical protein n=1 Tax=Streptomyces sp. NPDC048720 TaxID=3365588 RepID=UPI00370FF8CF